MFTQNFRKLFLGAALTLSLGGGIARAADMDGVTTTQVSTAGLDLRSSEGVAALHRRIRVAAVKLCTQPEAGGEPIAQSFGDCVQEVVRDASPQIDQLVASANGTAKLTASLSPAK